MASYVDNLSEDPIPNTGLQHGSHDEVSSGAEEIRQSVLQLDELKERWWVREVD